MVAGDFIHAVFNQTRVLHNDCLPSNTIMVSRDIYDRLREWHERCLRDEAFAILAMISFTETMDLPRWFVDYVDQQI